ncbi:MAG: hypothetical protein PHD02_02480 [Bacilli bacterium]|nr:hypothetical protein [Bacilli bacterium]
MSFISSILLFLKTFLEMTFKALLPVIILIAIWIIGKILYRYFRYGIKEFDFLKKRESTKAIDLVLNMLANIPGKRKVFKPNNLKSDLVVLDKTGIYLFKIVRYKGYVIGERKDLELENKITLTKIENVENPFITLDKDKEDILKIDKSLKVNEVLIVNNISTIKIKGIHEGEYIYLKNFYYHFKILFDKEEVYSEDKIKEIKKIII